MKWQCVRFLTALACIVTVGLFIAHAADAPKARSPVEGIWQWDFTMPDGGKVTPRVEFRTKENVLTGTSRFRFGSRMPLTNINLRGDQLSFDVVRERDDEEEVVTQYRGRMSGDSIKGKITSKANGEERSYDWVAKRVSPLEGVWSVSTDVGRERPIEAKLTLEQEGEKLSGSLTTGWGKVDIHRGKFKDGRISFETERRRRDGGEKSTNRYHGKVIGDKMEGKVEMNSFGSSERETNFWDAVRAD